MKERTCCLFIFNGFADWEPALAIANMHKHSDFAIRTFSPDGQPVRSMGNMLVQPDWAINEVDPASTDLLLLPGGDIWEQGGNEEVAPLVTACLNAHQTVAAICAATVHLAKHGHLDKVAHTSNDLAYLKNLSPSYTGENLYQNKPCVTSDYIITANGAAMIEFAIAIFAKFQLADADTLGKIFTLYKSGGMEH